MTSSCQLRNRHKSITAVSRNQQAAYRLHSAETVLTFWCCILVRYTVMWTKTLTDSTKCWIPQLGFLVWNTAFLPILCWLKQNAFIMKEVVVTSVCINSSVLKICITCLKKITYTSEIFNSKQHSSRPVVNVVLTIFTKKTNKAKQNKTNKNQTN